MRWIKDAIVAAVKEVMLPELSVMKVSLAKLEEGLAANNQRLDDVIKRLDDQSRRIDETNKRLDRLYEVVVRREEHEKLAARMDRIEQEMAELKKRIAA